MVRWCIKRTVYRAARLRVSRLSPIRDVGLSVGTVFVKTFSLNSDLLAPESQRRIETRLLVRNPRGWVGYSFRWNDEQTDAVLLGGAATHEVAGGADGRQGQQTWYFPSRADCMTCHTQAAGFVLGANTRQLNRSNKYQLESVNQLAAFAAAGVFRQPLPSTPETLPAFHDWNLQTGTLDDRARAYLDVNCSTCHTPPAYTRLDLRHYIPLLETATINHPPEKPRIGPPDSRLIVPGDPGRSEILLRMQQQTTGRMPDIASSVVDSEGVDVIRAWIESLKPGDYPDLETSE